MQRTRLYVLVIFSLAMYSCSDDEEQITLEVNDFSTSIPENPESGTSLGSLMATSNSAENITFELVSQSVEGAISLTNDGGIVVADPEAFDFETNTIIEAVAMAMVEGLTGEINISIAVSDVDESTSMFNIWSGESIVFEKAGGSDPTAMANQDRITDNVWITRGNDGGEIYNAALETASTKNVSPMGTEWALGTTEDIASLTFSSFRATISPSQVVDKDLVLHLIEDDIYIDIKFLSWAGGGQQGNAGGFSYERSTE